MRGGTGALQKFTLREKSVVRIGRGLANDIVLDFAGVSVYHARLLFRKGKAGPEICLRDESKNGTGVRPPDPGVAAGEWEPLKRNGVRSLGHGWQIIVPLRSRQGEKQMRESMRTLTIFIATKNRKDDDLDGEAWEPPPVGETAAVLKRKLPQPLPPPPPPDLGGGAFEEAPPPPPLPPGAATSRLACDALPEQVLSGGAVAGELPPVKQEWVSRARPLETKEREIWDLDDEELERLESEKKAREAMEVREKAEALQRKQLHARRLAERARRKQEKDAKKKRKVAEEREKLAEEEREKLESQRLEKEKEDMEERERVERKRAKKERKALKRQRSEETGRERIVLKERDDGHKKKKKRRKEKRAEDEEAEEDIERARLAERRRAQKEEFKRDGGDQEDSTRKGGDERPVARETRDRKRLGELESGVLDGQADVNDTAAREREDNERRKREREERDRLELELEVEIAAEFERKARAKQKRDLGEALNIPESVRLHPSEEATEKLEADKGMGHVDDSVGFEEAQSAPPSARAAGTPPTTALVVVEVSGSTAGADGFYLFCGAHNGRRMYRKLSAGPAAYLFFRREDEGEGQLGGWRVGRHPDENATVEVWNNVGDLPPPEVGDAGGRIFRRELDGAALTALTELSEDVRQEVRGEYAVASAQVAAANWRSEAPQSPAPSTGKAPRSARNALDFFGAAGTPQQSTPPPLGTPAAGTPAAITPAMGPPAATTPALARGPSARTTPGGVTARGTPAGPTPAKGTPVQGTPVQGTPTGGLLSAVATPVLPASDGAAVSQGAASETGLPAVSDDERTAVGSSTDDEAQDALSVPVAAGGKEPLVVVDHGEVEAGTPRPRARSGSADRERSHAAPAPAPQVPDARLTEAAIAAATGSAPGVQPHLEPDLRSVSPISQPGIHLAKNRKRSVSRRKPKRKERKLRVPSPTRSPQKSSPRTRRISPPRYATAKSKTKPRRGRENTPPSMSGTPGTSRFSIERWTPSDWRHSSPGRYLTSPTQLKTISPSRLKTMSRSRAPSYFRPSPTHARSEVVGPSEVPRVKKLTSPSRWKPSVTVCRRSVDKKKAKDKIRDPDRDAKRKKEKDGNRKRSRSRKKGRKNE